MAKGTHNYRSCTNYDPWGFLGNKYYEKQPDKLSGVNRKAANVAWEQYLKTNRTKQDKQDYCDKMFFVTGIRVKVEDLN